MSTKCTIAYGDDFHLYQDYYDGNERERVYLTIRKDPNFQASADQVTVAIPIHIWEYIRDFSGMSFELVDKTPEDLQMMVEKEVDERIKEYLESNKNPWFDFIGSGVFGGASESREEQVKLGLESYQREQKFQQDTLKLIEKLRKHNERV